MMHYQIMEWRRAGQQHSNLPEPSTFGWDKKDNQYSSTTRILPCAKESLLHLVNCGSEKGPCVLNCKCRAQSLRCTELCRCGGDEEICDNNDYQDEASEDNPDGDDQQNP